MRKRRAPALAPIGLWVPGEYLIAAYGEPITERGRIHAGLGISQMWPGSPRGRRPPAWSVTHLGTGHRVCIVEVHEAEAFALATKIAELTDWDFDGLDGWKNRDPELPAKWAAFATTHPQVGRRGGASYAGAARQIAEARA